ncbi:MAG: histidine phosphatase family protein [Bacteroidetes bacterium]|nr:histidine phosphatase family protein [Bacteroidota bacterium]
MKSIYLLRHAKSDWSTPFGNDHDRKLNDRGIASAGVIGRHLSSAVKPPQLILCSTARRTRETIELLTSASNWKAPVSFDAGIYDASTEDIFSRIRLVPETIDIVMIVGHQPTTGAVASLLLDGTPVEIPTCAFLYLEAKVDNWFTIGKGCATLKHYAIPRDFMEDTFD